MNNYPLLIKSHLFFENGEFVFFSPKDSIIDQSKSTTWFTFSSWFPQQRKMWSSCRVWRASEGKTSVWSYIYQTEHLRRYSTNSDYDKLGVEVGIMISPLRPTLEPIFSLNTRNTYKDLQHCDLSYLSFLHWEGVLKNKYWSDLCFS